MKLDIHFDPRQLTALRNFGKGIAKVVNKAGSTALRDMRSEASKRIRARKRLKAATIGKAFRLRRLAGVWALDVRGTRVPLIAYPHRQNKRGVVVEVNRGKRTLIEHAFIATMRSGHKGIFQRTTRARLPIKELFGSRPVDALLHKGEAEAVAERGRRSFVAAFERLMLMEGK